MVIPAYNEAKRIRATLAALQLSLRESGLEDAEVIVADDSSTDETAALAREMGATVVHSGKRNIGGTRNVGAAVATGEYLLFLDADTLVSPALLGELRAHMERGVLGGGARIALSEPSVWWAEWIVSLWNSYSRLSRTPAGSFFFMRREAFEKVGGFDERWYVSEELHLGKALKKLGKLVILREAAATSPRKAHEFTWREHLRFYWIGLRAPIRTLQDPEKLEIWYTRRD